MSLGLENRGRPVGPGSLDWEIRAELQAGFRQKVDEMWAAALEGSMAEIIAAEINRALNGIDVALMFADALEVEPWQRNLFVAAVVSPRANAGTTYAGRSRFFRPRAEAAARRIAAELTEAGHADGWLLPGHRFDWNDHDAPV